MRVWAQYHKEAFRGQVNDVREFIDETGAYFVFPLRFPGQYHDRATGLFYNYYRYYDPQLGRYITYDPLGILPGLVSVLGLPRETNDYYQSFTTQQILKKGLNHTYVYVENNPIRNIDLLGLSQMNHGPVGERGCRTTCITNFIGGGFLAAGASRLFGAVFGGGWVASTTGYLGGNLNTLYSNFSLGTCLDKCDKEDGCK